MTASNVQQIQPIQPSTHSKKDDEIDLTDLIANLSAHKWTIAIIAAVIFAFAAIYVFTATPIYRAVALVEVEEKKEGIPLTDLSDMFGQGPSGKKELVLIKSYMILGETVNRLKLNIGITPHFFPFIGSGMFHRYKSDGLAEPLFGLGSYAWGGEALDIDHFDVLGELSSEVSEWQILVGENNEYLLLNKEGDQVLAGRVGEVSAVKYRDSNLEIFVNRLIARPGQRFYITHSPKNLMVESLRRKLGVSEEGSDTGMITFSLDGVNKKKITSILNTITSFYVESNKEKHVEDAQQVLDFIDDQLPELRESLDDAQRKLQTFRQEAGTVDMEFETQLALTQIMEYEKMIIEMEINREELRFEFTEKSNKVKVMDKQIEKIQGKIAKLENKMHVLPEKEWEFIQKTLEVEVASELYVALLNKGLELQVTKASTLANVRVIDSAELLYSPVKPKKPLILVVSLALGLILGAAWVMLRIMLHKGVEDPDLIEQETGIPVFANIPHSEVEGGVFSKIAKRKSDESGEVKLLAFENDTDLAMEAMRSFRTNMRFTMKGEECGVIIISGPSPSIGKSFFASNYSAIAAKDGQRVLLIDADMRKGHLHKQMGVSISPGLSELIAGDISIEEAIHEIKDGFQFISCGERPPNSAELVSSDQFQALLEKFKQYVDLVIIDTPPILAVADASIIAQYGGQLFLLLRSGQHPMGEIQAAASKFQKSGVKITGILLNDVKNKASGYAYEYK